MSTLADVRSILVAEDAQVLTNINEMFPHDVSPTGFLVEGLDLEEQQWVLLPALHPNLH